MLHRPGREAGQFPSHRLPPAGQAALERAARFLFGPGRELGRGRTEWAGAQAEAVLSSNYLDAQPSKELASASVPARLDRVRREQAHLRAENDPP